MSKIPTRPEAAIETQQFEAVPSVEQIIERQEFELNGSLMATVKAEFRHPIELRFGCTDETPPCYLVRYPWTEAPQHQRYAVVQPEVIPSVDQRGWLEFGAGLNGGVRLGRGTSPEFGFAPDVSRKHCLMWETSNEEGCFIEIENYGRNGMRVIAHPDDLARKVEPFVREYELWD